MVLAPNKNLAAQLYGEMKELSWSNAAEYFVSYYDYYQPEAYVPSSDTFIERSTPANERYEDASVGHQALLERRDVVRGVLGDSRPRRPGPVSEKYQTLHLTVGMLIDQRGDPASSGRTAVYPQRSGPSSVALFACAARIDVFPAESDDIALRIELFDEEAWERSGRCSTCSPSHVEGTVLRYTIYPKTHYVTP